MSAWVRNGCQMCLVSTQLSEFVFPSTFITHTRHALGCARSTHSRLSGSILHLAHHSAQLMFPSTYHSTLGCAPNSLCQALRLRNHQPLPPPTFLGPTWAGARVLGVHPQCVTLSSINQFFPPSSGVCCRSRSAAPRSPPEGPQAVLAPCTSFRGALQGARWGRCGVRAGGVKGIGVSRCCSRGSWNGSAWPAPRGRD